MKRGVWLFVAALAVLTASIYTLGYQRGASVPTGIWFRGPAVADSDGTVHASAMISMRVDAREREVVVDMPEFLAPTIDDDGRITLVRGPHFVDGSDTILQFHVKRWSSNEWNVAPAAPKKEGL